MSRVFYFFLLVPSALGRNGFGQECVTSNGEKGRCLEIVSCMHVYNTVKNIIDNEAANYLKSVYCGRRDNIPLVCCGNNDELQHVCGDSKQIRFKNLIYNGEKTKTTEHPWLVLLRYGSKSKYLCGGTLINSRFVLTAAHCIRKRLIQIRAGFNNVGNTDEFFDFNILNISIHPKYNFFRKGIYDIALLKIEKVPYRDNIRWICLPPMNAILPKIFEIVGYGETNYERYVPISSTKFKGTVPYLDSNHCEQIFPNVNINAYSNLIICAGNQTSVDACVGDSGGPLVAKKENSSLWQIHGIISAGSSTCQFGSTGIYTRVDRFLDWIDETMLNML